MNRILILFAAVLLTLTACNKSDNNGTNPGNNTNLNATEQKLLGTWYLKKEIDNNGSGSNDSFTFSKILYITFKADPNPGAVGGGGGSASKVITDAAGLYLAANGQLRESIANAVDMWWWYDEKAAILRGGKDYSIKLLSSNQLILQYNSTQTLYFEK